MKKPENPYPHNWKIVKMSDGRRVKRCSLCLYAYDFGYDLPCPAKKPKVII